MEGWRFNPPRSWPVEAGFEPERGWRPPEEWGRLPPGHQLWLPEHPRPRRWAPPVVALLAVSALLVAAFVVPRGDRPEVRTVASRSGAVAEIVTRPAGRVEAALPSSPIKKRVTSHPVRRFRTCARLRQTYPHGVGLRTARDRPNARTGTTVVTNFAKNARVYAANKPRDRDGDGIACELP